MRRFWILLLLMLGGAGPAWADDPIIALRNFGLLGTWSQNCTAPITDAMILLRFTETSFAEPRLILSHPDDIFFESDIRAASLMAPDRIALTIEGGLGSPAQTLIFRRAGDTLSLVSPSSPSWPAWHRCVSE